MFTAGNTVFYDAPLLYCPNPQYPVTHTINRKKFNDARKEFKSFLTYARGMIKLRGDEGFEFETVAQPSGGTLFRVITELSKSADPEEQYRALLHAMPTVRWSWRRGTGVRVCTVAQFLAHFDKLLLKAHSDTLLDRKVVTSGALVFDRYAKYTRDKTLDSAT